MEVTMGRHKLWRKFAKKERRKKIRTLEAIKRDDFINTASYIQEQDLLYQLEIEKINRINKEENEKWLQAETLSLEQWNKLQQQKAILKQHQLEQEAKLKLEWELEQKRKKEEEERLKTIEEEMKKKREIFMENLDKFMSGDATNPPAELLVARETRPDCEPCPFFLKTACCRFGDQCSRNHQYPGISNVLLAANFYTHFGLNNANLNEYDTDIMLEYEENETYKEFKDFFYDVLSEFEKFGKIVQFKIRKRCPKGRACNFLHVFRNPGNLFSGFNNDYNRNTERYKQTPSRYWRWSESPETDIESRSSDKRHTQMNHNSERRESRRRRESEGEDYRKSERRRRCSSPRRKSYRR